ncbi:MAG: hypothetical protein BV456_11950, partial [Thermoplasmata archaeon M8B2D]
MNKNHLFIKGLIITIIIFIINVSIVPSIYGYKKQADLVDDSLSQSYIYGYNEESSNLDKFSYNSIKGEYISEPLLWWKLWNKFPGRYEEFFDVSDIIDLGQAAWGLGVADFNSDSYLDFVASWSPSPWTQSTISLFMNNGDNSFTQNDIYTISEPLYRYIYDLDSGDFDNDGDVDLMFAYCNKTGPTDDSYICLLFNDGDNNFGDCTIIAEIIKGNRINPTITTADYDNDGDIDFLIGDNSGLVEFYKNDGTGNFSSSCISDFGKEMSWGVASADYDNDGDIDFITTQIDNIDTGYIYLKRNDGSEDCFNHSDYIQIAELSNHQHSFFAQPVMVWGYLCPIDYNDDGKMDFLYGSSDSIFIYIQQEDGIFDYFHFCRLPMFKADDDFWDFYADDLRHGGIATGDFNNDGLDDMIIGGAQGIIRLCYNNLVLVDIVKPDRSAVYINNRIVDIPFTDPIMLKSFVENGVAIVTGDLTIEIKPLEPLSKVEFYLNGILRYTDDSEPFEWSWT